MKIRLIQNLLCSVIAVSAVIAGGASAPAQNNSGISDETQPASRSDLPDPIRAEWLYNGVNRPFMIQIANRDAIGPLQLVLFDAQNRVASGPIDVRPGRQDLAELMPEVWQLRETVYLQLLEYGRPTGSSLVLQPMLTRMVPVTQQANRPDGSAYTKITNWQSEMEPVPAAENSEPAQNENEKLETQGNESSTTSAPLAAQTDASHVFSVGNEQLLSGIRAYPERDVEMITNEGRILLAMRPDAAPNTAWNFLRLCEGGFYREVAFHRVVPISRGQPFVIQAGDPTATGEGGAGYWLPIENSNLPHDFGVISMARADDPDSAGSQFFICLSRAGTARLDGQYCAFGTAIDGDDTIWKIANVELADVAAGKPAKPPLIIETRLVPSPPRIAGEVRLPTWLKPTTPEKKPDGPVRVPR